MVSTSTVTPIVFAPVSSIPVAIVIVHVYIGSCPTNDKCCIPFICAIYLVSCWKSCFY
ncbi:hypothetical protein B0H11DRAFT_1963751 [Mycena galericulata]|nr:hypothetical protein B0H11DRAFT_2111174 [Mycena galericulata]KAJ7509073.1 hypothetical protein B0H11DRAFT_1963751 [Mycena galericulata]